MPWNISADECSATAPSGAEFRFKEGKGDASDCVVCAARGCDACGVLPCSHGTEFSPCSAVRKDGRDGWWWRVQSGTANSSK